MPRMQVYLPDELYEAVKQRRLPASELLQEAVRTELRRRELVSQADRYIEDLRREVGEPSLDASARADTLTSEIRASRSRKTG